MDLTKKLVGKKLLSIDPLTEKEAETFWPGETWGYRGCVVLAFEGGLRLVASRDPEGNGPGAIFVREGNSGSDISIIGSFPH